MKRFISWHDYVNLYPRPKRFECDSYSRTIVQQFVERFCGCKCTYFSPSNQESCLDFNMYNVRSGKRFVCEIKDRWKYVSTAFYDHIIENVKLQSLLKRLQKGDGQYISLFTIYDDGVIKATSDIIKDLMGSKYTNAPSTTALDNHDYVGKDFILIKPTIRYYFCIYEDTDNPNKSNFYAHFDNEPINIQKLNEKLQAKEQTIALF